MLEAEIKSQLGEYLTRLVTPVQITASGRPTSG